MSYLRVQSKIIRSTCLLGMYLKDCCISVGTGFSQYIHMGTYVYIRMHMHMNMHIRMRVRMHMHKHMQMYTYMFLCGCSCSCMYIMC